VPKEYLHLIIGTGSSVGEWLRKDDRIDFYSFTGSLETGIKIKESSGTRGVTLELGSNAATIVHNDVNIKEAAEKCAIGAFSNAGQTCISLQRIYIQESIYDDFLKELSKE